MFRLIGLVYVDVVGFRIVHNVDHLLHLAKRTQI